MPKYSGMDIVIEKVTLVRGGNTRARVDIRIIGLLRLRDLRIIQQPNGEEPWLGMPTVEVFDARERKTKHTPMVELLDKDLKEAVASAVISAYQKGSFPRE